MITRATGLFDENSRSWMILKRYWNNSNDSGRPDMITFYNHLHSQHQGKGRDTAARWCRASAAGPKCGIMCLLNQRTAAWAACASCRLDAAALERIHSPRYPAFWPAPGDQWVALTRRQCGQGHPAFGLAHAHFPHRHRARQLCRQGGPAIPTTPARPSQPAPQWHAQGEVRALSAAQQVLDGDRVSLCLSRPPGHHAGRTSAATVFNNAALAAQHLRNGAARRWRCWTWTHHHGNGTQAIFMTALTCSCQHPRRPAHRIPVLPGPCGRNRGGRGRGE